jgi:hypothetical protein
MAERGCEVGDDGEKDLEVPSCASLMLTILLIPGVGTSRLHPYPFTFLMRANLQPSNAGRPVSNGYYSNTANLNFLLSSSPQLHTYPAPYQPLSRSKQPQPHSRKTPIPLKFGALKIGDNQQHK